MELLQLRYFCSAAESQNFSVTARTYMVPPSNISQSIKRLERELGQELFERSANRIRLNEAGADFYGRVRTALDMLDGACNALQQRERTVRINVHVARRIVMDAVEEHRRSHPQTAFITSHSAAGLSGSYDIIVTDELLALPWERTEAACEEILLAYNAAAIPLPERLTAAELETVPFITMTSDSSIYGHFLRICASLGFTPHIALQGEDPLYIRKCIELGLGAAFVPALSWSGQFSEKVTLRKVGEYKRHIYVYRQPSADAELETFYQGLLRSFDREGERI